jgi:hypothetical protein
MRRELGHHPIRGAHSGNEQRDATNHRGVCLPTMRDGLPGLTISGYGHAFRRVQFSDAMRGGLNLFHRVF